MDYKTAADTDLAEACKNGDDGAFQELMNRYVRSVFAFVRGYTKSDANAEDVIQDSFFKAWRHIGRFEKGRSFRPWLFAIARNTALDHIKKRRTVSFSELDDDDSDLAFADTVEDTGPIASELFAQKEIAGELSEVLEKIHPDHRAVLQMHYHEELTFEEIAEIMGRPMNTVKSWHRRALAKIKKLMPHRNP